MGYQYCRDHSDKRVGDQKKHFKKRLKMMRYFLSASTIFIQNRKSEILLKEIKVLFRSYFGKPNTLTLAASTAVIFLSIKEYLRCRIFGDMRNPETLCLVHNDDHERKGHLVKIQEGLGISSKMAFSLPEQMEH
jgi:hypothetical protein